MVRLVQHIGTMPDHFLADEFQTVTYKKQSNGNNGNIEKDNNDDYNKWKKEKDKRLRTGFRSQKYENSIYTKKKKKNCFVFILLWV